MSTLYDMRSGTLVKSKLYNNGLLLKDSLAFNPLSLFKDGKQGVWYEPSDKSTLFQDVAGTVPVTKDGDPVALMRDKSGNGNHAIQTISTARPIYKTDGILHWLEFDGINDHLNVTLNSPSRYNLWFNIKTVGKNPSYLVDTRPYASAYQYNSDTVGFTYLYPSDAETSNRMIAEGDWDGVGAYQSDEKLSKRITLFSRNTSHESAKVERFYSYLMTDASETIELEIIATYLASKSGVTL